MQPQTYLERISVPKQTYRIDMKSNILIRVTDSDKNAIIQLATTSHRSISSVVQLMIQHCLQDKNMHKLLGGANER
jgi:hypothetical protein